MLLDIREREREAQANRLAQVAARPGPARIADPHPPAFNALAGLLLAGRGAFQPPEPEPPRPAVQTPGFNSDGSFEWIDNPSM